ncbi:MAG TPA: hydroxyisourate hydrolase [Polyangia bacterium]|nr:hydroxyisourate hydrolase [Polyangia bacterium]
MKRISTHVLDVALGRPAAGVAVRLDLLPPASAGGGTVIVTSTATDDDGRVADLLDGAPLAAGVYRLTFQTGAYFAATGREAFYPRVQVTFEVTAPDQHHHVPLLLSPFGYSTYRGS